MVVISDTTTLSTLAQMGDLWILEKQFPEVTLPLPVFQELEQLSQFDFDVSIFREAKWLKIKSATETPVLNLLLTLVDIGEAHAIALAVEEKADLLIIDEKKGRSIAKSMNLNFTGRSYAPKLFFFNVFLQTEPPLRGLLTKIWDDSCFG